MAYDAATGKVVMFGGDWAFSLDAKDPIAPACPELGDTWTWDGSNWTEQHTATSPSPRNWAAMVYDDSTGLVVLFGGDAFCNGGSMADTWTWDGSNWTEQHPATSPPADADPLMAYDHASGRVVLLGGGTWIWDGSNWTEQNPASNPTYELGASMTYDAANKTVVLYTGNTLYSPGFDDLGGTWTWDGSTWTEQHPKLSPPPRAFASMFYDGADRSVVLFGGREAGVPNTALSDTWTWDGTDWALEATPTAPSPRVEAAAVWDTSTSSAVLFGGEFDVWYPVLIALDDTWTYASLA